MVQNKNLSDLLHKLSEQENISSFLFVLHCNFNQDIISTTISLVEKNLVRANVSPTVVKKIKLISVEILQNITKHQYFVSGMLPYFIIGSSNDGITIFSGNIVSAEEKLIIQDRLKIYNSIEPEEIKNYYLNSLDKASITLEGNAGIGLLDIVYRSNQQVQYDFDDLQENLFHFGLNVKVNEKQVVDKA